MADETIPKEEVMAEAPVEPISEPVQAPETPTDQIPVNEPLPTLTESEAELITENIPEESKPTEMEIKPELKPEPIPEPVKKEIKSESVSEPVKTESKPVEQIPETKSESKQETKSEPEQPKIIPVIIPSKNLARELLVKARNMIQFRKRKKLDKVMTLFLKKQKITNDEVEKFMHVSDATATRYLSQLEKENKIKQSGKTGKFVFYSKI